MQPEVTVGAELKAAQQLIPNIAARGREIESARRVPADIVKCLVDEGLVDMAVPMAYGGRASDPLDIVKVIEAISYADGSTGWCLMNYQTSALVSAFLPQTWGEAIFGANERCVPAGVLAPTARGRFVDGGIVVNGRWRFGSGCDNANWLLGTALMVNDDGKPQTKADGSPEILWPMFSMDQISILDTWYVSGLCGSGSHDLEVTDAFVPEGRWLTSLADPAVIDEPLFRFPILSLFPPTVVAVPLGIARAALDSFLALARDKVPHGAAAPLAQRSSAQIDAARAEALIEGARGYVYETTDSLWKLVQRGQDVTSDARRRVRLAACHACEAVAQAVNLLYRAGGGSAIFDDNPLQRHFRDIHATTQHIQISHGNFETMGRLRLTGSLDLPY